jgi:iron complex outermembrane receptor protein
MKKEMMMLVGAFCITTQLYAQEVRKDSVKQVSLDNVEIVATRANQQTPVAFTTVTAKELAAKNLGQDIPYLLSSTPSVITTSDTGIGLGYTSFRVRGTDPTRVNITVNGIPMNDAESSKVYFVNMPDLTSSLRDIQVQRGAGTSTNGGGAFGASVNMKTKGFTMQPYASFSSSYGSFNTHKESLLLGTGLMKNHWTVDARLSNLGTDGYIDRASVALNSYLFQVGYFAGKTSLRFLTFNGKEKTYHAWNYASKAEMKKYGRTYNSCGAYTDDAGNTRYYQDQTDNYHQQNYQLILSQELTDHLNMHAALHYTKGEGYYEQYKSGRKLANYKLTPFETIKEGKRVLVERTDLVRRKMMENDFGGMVFSLNYKSKRLDAVLGGGLNRYVGDHFGRVIWVKNYVGALAPNHTYYSNQGRKTDGNIYAKAAYALTSQFNLWADMQYRHINYQMNGPSDNGVNFNINDTFDFFNPKFGVNYQINAAQRVYASLSVAHKEPTRDNYKDLKAGQKPTAERMLDYELGYQYRNRWLSAGVNLYYMNYKDQLVPTGEANAIGEAVAINMPKSYRMGIEAMVGMQPVKHLNIDLNATWSRNRIQDFSETLYKDYADPIVINHGDTPIAYSPDFIANGTVRYTLGGFETALQTQYVSKQYMTNAKDEQAVLDAYFVSNLTFNYHFSLPGVKKITVGCTLYNLFDEEYENNGFAGRSYDLKNGQRVIQTYAAYAAQAGIHAMGHLTLNF